MTVFKKEKHNIVKEIFLLDYDIFEEKNVRSV